MPHHPIQVRAATCDGPTCATFRTDELATAGGLPTSFSSAIGPTGNPSVSYVDPLSSDLTLVTVAHSSWYRNGWGR